MNRYDEKYDIRLGKRADISEIMHFIDTYWKKNHILARDRELFEYEFVDGENVNVVIAVDRETNAIQGMLGILCSSRTPGKRDCWGCMWKAMNGNGNIPFLGIEISKRVPELIDIRYRIGVGSNPNTSVPLNKMMFEREVVKLKQYYYPNKEKTDYQIAVIKEIVENDEAIGARQSISFYELKSMEDFEQFIDIEKINAIPYKDNWYINHRYYNHPRYKYKVLGVCSQENEKAVVVGREIQVGESKILRVVDYLGEHALIQEMGPTLDEWVKEYEYIDFYEYGFSDESLKMAGFVNREDTENTIPNYFEPFVQSNVDIWGFVTCEGTTICKADGDQDRPNI